MLERTNNSHSEQRQASGQSTTEDTQTNRERAAMDSEKEKQMEAIR